MAPIVRWTGRELLAFPASIQEGAFLDPCALVWRKTADPGDSIGQPLADSDTGLLYFAYNWSTRSVFSFFDPRRNVWRAQSLPGTPDVSWVLQPFAVGDRGLLLWGARANFNHSWTNEDFENPKGFWYDLPSNQWRATRSGTLAGRFDAAMVWTGQQIFVWGGRLPNDAGDVRAPAGLACKGGSFPYQCAFGDGALYDPARDVWSPISAVGAPAPSSGNTALWNGKQVLVWDGGVGHLYDPRANSWSGPISIPSPGQSPTVGKLSAQDRARFFLLRDQLYDPERDRWSELPPAPPGGAACGQGDWLQSNALVWMCFGADRKHEFRVYSFDTATWTVIPPWPNEPDEIGSVWWTGTQLIVWGGWRYGATPPNPCGSAPPGVGCDPPGPEHVPINEGAVVTP